MAAVPGGDADRLARVALGQLLEPGDLRVAGLTTELGATRLYARLREERDDTGLFTDAASRLEPLDPARDLERAERLGIRFLVPGDPEWPHQVDDLDRAEPLQQRGGAPLGLWVRGPLRLDEVTRSVAVVGSRSATTYGVDTALAVSAAVARAGWCVVSGAAFGIDQAAHRGALSAGGPTVAVLACGVDRAYPRAHQSLLDHLAAEAAVVSELAPGRSPTRLRFLARNRLIAALSAGTVIVEAATRSGALNTANWAGRLNRGLMGVPGPVTSASSQGVHHLVRSGAATLVTCGEDVLEMVAPAGEHLLGEPRGRRRSRDRLTHRQQQVLDAVPATSGAGSESVARTAGIGLVEVASALGSLHRAGFVERGEGGWQLTPLAYE